MDLGVFREGGPRHREPEKEIEGTMHNAYPEMGSGEPASSSRSAEQDDGTEKRWHKCPGCKTHMC